MSSKEDLHSGCLNRLLGVMITNGLRKGSIICPVKENRSLILYSNIYSFWYYV